MGHLLESRGDIAAASTPVTTGPVSPAGSWATTKWGTMRSALEVAAIGPTAQLGSQGVAITQRRGIEACDVPGEV